jgi:hypothetical protein
MERDEWGPLGPITQSPDDLMELPTVDLAVRLVTRVRRLRRFEELARVTTTADSDTVRWAIKRENALVRVAEAAARAKVRELAFLVVHLGTMKSL